MYNILYIINKSMNNFTHDDIKRIIKTPGVYYIKCKNHNYVGSTVSLRDRLIDHKNALHKNKHPNKHMQNIFNKYGEEVFKFSILESLDTTDIKTIRICEKKWMDLLGPTLNFKLDPVNETNSITQSKVVYQYKLNGEYIDTYPSASEAARVLNLNSPAISAVARGELLSTGGFYFSYVPIKDYMYSLERSKWKWIGVKMIIIKTGEEKMFKNIAEAAKYIGGETGNLKSISASISSIMKGRGKILQGKYTFIKL